MSLEDRLLALLADGELQTTAAVIAAVPDVPGWQVRRCLDRLAVDGRLCWRPGKNNASRLWRLNPSHSKAAS